MENNVTSSHPSDPPFFPARFLLVGRGGRDAEANAATPNARAHTPEGQIVVFPDPGLEAAIRESIDKPAGDLYDTDVQGMTSLSAADRDVASIEGIGSCTSLARLYLRDKLIVDRTPLSQRTRLTDLDLHSNRIVDLAPLANLSQLSWLQLRGDPLDLAVGSPT